MFIPAECKNENCEEKIYGHYLKKKKVDFVVLAKLNLGQGNFHFLCILLRKN